MGKKKDAALHGMTKAERKALKAREAAIAAELAAREKKAAKKAAKKAKAERLVETTAPSAELTDVEKAVIADAKAEREAARKRELVEEAARLNAEAKPAKKSAKAKVADAAEKAKATPSSEGARLDAEDAAEAAAEADDDESDESIKARIRAKREARAKATAPIGGVTSSVEALDVIADGPKPETVKKVKAAVEALKAEVEQVETEHGREFVGAVELGDGSIIPAPTLDNFAKPSEAPKGDFETNGNNQYKVKRPTDGKVVGYTRATTYIANLEDRSMLEKWKLRLVLEGVGVHDRPADIEGGIPEPVAARMADLIHRRDVAIAKARKADRKGKLIPGQVATIVDGAWSEFKKAVNVLAEELLDLGGANEKSQKGTDLHALMELHDREGIDAVGDMLRDGLITPADLADVEAYAEAVKRAGIKFDLIEQTVVNDELKVGGRLDRTALVKFPGMVRATRCVADIKTGSIELGAGKLAQQLEMYSSSVAYDLDTNERVDMKLSRTKAIVIHVPQGTGTAFIYAVDLTLGRKGNKLSGEVRAWRNEGKRAVDFKTDLARPETFSMIEQEV